MAITNTTGETFPAGASVLTATKLNNIVNAMTTTMATGKVLGRATIGTGAVEELATTGTGSVVLATSPTLVTPILGTPTSGVVTNLTGTASININGTVGATTPATGAFTTLGATGIVTVSDASGRLFFNGANYGLVSATAGDMFVNAASGKSVFLSINSVNLAALTSTGLAVTGALSATGDITAGSDIKSTGNPIIYSSNGGGAGTVQAGIQFIGSSDEVRVYANTATVGSFTPTGLAVTGALTSSTGFGCNGNAAQTKYASGGLLAGVVAALVANGILSN